MVTCAVLALRTTPVYMKCEERALPYTPRYDLYHLSQDLPDIATIKNAPPVGSGRASKSSENSHTKWAYSSNSRRIKTMASSFVRRPSLACSANLCTFRSFSRSFPCTMSMIGPTALMIKPGNHLSSCCHITTAGVRTVVQS